MGTFKLEAMSRPVWGGILLAAAVFAIAGAAALEALGWPTSSVRPLPFVGAVVCIKLGLFFFWPVIARRGREASTILHDMRIVVPREKPSMAPRHPSPSLMLWDDRDPRIDVSLFSANVPTFVLSPEQKFLDWNPAFHLVFGDAPGIVRGGDVGQWFSLLDNFKKVSVRQDKLYGEGILPLADRERATYLSPEFGRMVFTKIMSPIVDRRTGRIIGWNVVLNINSVAKRSAFLEKLFAGINRESKRIRFAAAIDGVFSAYPAHETLVRHHVAALSGARRILDLGAGTGTLAQALAANGRRVTAVERSLHLLRQLRDKLADDSTLKGRVRLVRLDPDRADLARRLPEARFDGVAMMQLGHRVTELDATLAAARKALRPGGILSFSAPMEGGSVQGLFDKIRAHLTLTGRYDELKHQLSQVLEHEIDCGKTTPYRFHSRETLRAAVLAAGFTLLDESQGLLDGHTIHLVARKDA